MRAFAVRSFGEPASVQDLPVPAADEAVLVRVRFAGVNPLDNNLLGRLNADSSYPFVVGIDFAGVAERVPAERERLRAGRIAQLTRVLARNRDADLALCSAAP
jgi:NADPH:quinone reductase-like Zn-dependent oxidoreductase